MLFGDGDVDEDVGGFDEDVGSRRDTGH